MGTVGAIAPTIFEIVGGSKLVNFVTNPSIFMGNDMETISFIVIP